MKIKKLGHCCLVVEIDGKRVITDPGSYTINEQELEKNIDIVLVTHEHQDHFHVDSLRSILKNNPNAIVVTNSSVGKILEESGIKYSKLEDGQFCEFSDIYFEAHGNTHQEIYEEIGLVQNTGYFIGKDFFYPGDAFTNPNKDIKILALPVAGPWTNIKQAVRYALEVKPKVCFPIHDWNMKIPGVVHRTPSIVLPKNGIEFKVLEIGKEEEI